MYVAKERVLAELGVTDRILTTVSGAQRGELGRKFAFGVNMAASITFRHRR